MQYIEYPQPPTLNQQLNSARANRFQAAGIKKTWTNKIARLSAELDPYDCPIWVAVEATYKIANCDQDNLYSSCKFIFDGLVKAGIIPNDNVKYIQSPVFYTYKKHDKKVIRICLFDDYQEYRQFILNRI